MSGALDSDQIRCPSRIECGESENVIIVTTRRAEGGCIRVPNNRKIFLFSFCRFSRQRPPVSNNVNNNLNNNYRQPLPVPMRYFGDTDLESQQSARYRYAPRAKISRSASTAAGVGAVRRYSTIFIHFKSINNSFRPVFIGFSLVFYPPAVVCKLDANLRVEQTKSF